MKSVMLLVLIAVPNVLAQEQEENLSRKNGPRLERMERKPGLAPHALLTNMFDAIENLWLPEAYATATGVGFRVSIDADLPARALTRQAPSEETVDFEITLDGVAAPNGRYRMEMDGGLGRVTIVDDLRRKLVTSQGFKSFSDTPRRTRPTNANLTNYRSWFLRYLGKMRAAVLKSGTYRSVYAGSGTHMGQEVHVIRLYKPGKSRPSNSRQPVPLRKLWTFWHDGGYEIWLYQGSYLPAVIFYANDEDNVFANVSFDYSPESLPLRIDFVNNSVGAEGRGDIVFDFGSDRVLRGASLRFDSRKGISLRLDATLDFTQNPDREDFRIIPPFGFRKMNRNHLELMILTEISGGLLELKKHGVNFKNFKF